VFTLDYHVDVPINTVFSPNAMLQYLQIFNFLWRLKRVEYTLSASWKTWGKASREFGSIPDFQQDLQLAQLTIQRMIHFIYQLQHYVLFEVSNRRLYKHRSLLTFFSRYWNAPGIN
jgi:gamma-tubulin complex component 3